MSSRRKPTVKAQDLVDEAISQFLTKLPLELKTEGGNYTLTPEARSKMSEIIMMFMKKLMTNAQELMNNAGSKKEITIDTIYRSYKLCVPPMKSPALYDKKTGAQIKEPQGLIDTFAAFAEVCLRIRSHVYQQKICQTSSLNHSDFMQQNQAVVSRRKELLFLETVQPKVVTAGTGSGGSS